jgi:hypothetical protein
MVGIKKIRNLTSKKLHGGIVKEIIKHNNLS